MPKNLFLKAKPSLGLIYKYGLEVIYSERNSPSTLSIFFCTIKYKKVEGEGWKLDSNKTYCYSFDYNFGKLSYVSHHNGDFTKLGFRWMETRTAQFEQDKIREEHRAQAKKTAQKAYDCLLEEKWKSPDTKWQEKHQPFLSSLETIIGKWDNI